MYTLTKYKKDNKNENTIKHLKPTSVILKQPDKLRVSSCRKDEVMPLLPLFLLLEVFCRTHVQDSHG